MCQQYDRLPCSIEINKGHRNELILPKKHINISIVDEDGCDILEFMIEYCVVTAQRKNRYSIGKKFIILNTNWLI